MRRGEVLLVMVGAGLLGACVALLGPPDAQYDGGSADGGGADARDDAAPNDDGAGGAPDAVAPPPAFINASSTPAVAQNSISVPRPDGVLEGDLLLAVVYASDRNSRVSAPSDWLERTAVTTPNECLSTVLYYYQYAPAPDAGGDVTFLQTGMNAFAAVIVAYRGVRSKDPFEIDKPYLEPPQGSQWQVPSYSTLRPNERLVVVVADDLGNGVAWSSTGMKWRADVGYAAAFDTVVPEAGPVPPATLSATTPTSNPCGALQLTALLPP
jgi:hypothetical protein